MISEARIPSITLAAIASPTAAPGDAGPLPRIAAMRGRMWRAWDQPIYNGLEVAARRTP